MKNNQQQNKSKQNIGLGVGAGFLMFLAGLEAISKLNKHFDVGPEAYFTALGPLLLTSFFSCFMFAIAYGLRKLKVISIATEEMEATATIFKDGVTL